MLRLKFGIFTKYPDNVFMSQYRNRDFIRFIIWYITRCVQKWKLLYYNFYCKHSGMADGQNNYFL